MGGGLEGGIQLITIKMAFWILSSTDGFWRVKQVLGKGDKSLLIETEFVPQCACGGDVHVTDVQVRRLIREMK